MMSVPETLLLIRHGQTDWNRRGLVQGQTDVPLDAVGKEQARRLALRLVELDLSALHASTLARATETADVIAQAVGLEPVYSSAWCEMNLGAVEGRSRKEALGDHADMASAAARTQGPLAEGAETWEQLQDRVLEAQRELFDAHAGERVALVGHGGSLKVLLAQLLGLERRSVPRLSVGSNAGLTIVEFHGGEPRLVLLNDTGHLRD